MPGHQTMMVPPDQVESAVDDAPPTGQLCLSYRCAQGWDHKQCMHEQATHSTESESA